MAQLKTSSGQVVTADYSTDSSSMYQQYLKGGATEINQAPAQPAPAAPAPATPVQTTSTPVNLISTSEMTNKPVLQNAQQQQKDLAGVQAALQDTSLYSKVASDGFINAAFNAAYGRNANADELAKVGTNQYGMAGLSVLDVVKKLKLDKYLKDYGMGAQDAGTQTAGTQESPAQSGIGKMDKTGDTTRDAFAEFFNSDLDEYEAAKNRLTGERQAVTDKSQVVNAIRAEIDTMKNELDYNQVLQTAAVANIKNDYYEQKDKIESRPIPMSEINKALNKMGNETNIALDKESIAAAVTNATNTYRYNSKLIEYNVALGDLQTAQQIAKDTAADIKEYKSEMLGIMSQVYQMDQNTRQLKQQEVDREYEMAMQGYTYVPNLDALKELAQKKGTEWVEANTTKIGGKIWIKPDTSKDIAFTQTIKGELIGYNSKGDVVKNFGRTSSYSFSTNDNGDYVITDPATGTVKTVTNGVAELSIGAGTITGANGSRAWEHGLDFVLNGGKGAAVKAPFIGEVIFAGKNGGFGNQVKIRAADGTEVWLSHLDSINVAKGDNVTEEMVVGTQGNTGNVYSLTGGDGTHLDITMKKADGSYYTPQEVAANLGYGGNKGSMNAYDKDVLVARIGKQIYGTKISDEESARVEGFIKEGMKQGKTEYEIMDDVLGFKISNQEIKPVAEAMRGMLLQNASGEGLAGYDMAGLARLLNDNDLPGAITKVETMIYQNARETDPDGFISESKVKSAIEKGNNLTAYIGSLKESPVGVVSGTMENWLGKLKGEEAATIKAQIVALVAKMRNEFAGSAVTPSEEKFLEPIIPSLNDSPANFAAKIEALKNNPLIELNNYRGTFGLSTLDEISLYNRNARVSSYMGKDNSNNNDPLGLF